MAKAILMDRLAPEIGSLVSWTKSSVGYGIDITDFGDEKKRY